ncbi:hypothetical protein QMK19_03415 [Streptomyces sp. H10-C2]|uniref:hypothetical protein n=1 Tax=unclassified Streptomyces TaxID=2593676 RepID=UPI0024BB4238|nr:MULTISPECIES: hypothetical protein [unclassified Streptomyces]MDJ0342235.1 hypothetical protein [Streptomyces sp. PH10-H1]MDJ0368749.1 hypothetical protein [Streptomyces sp. H10-C2]
MRLRQAQAMLDIATHLEAARLGFMTWPFEPDDPDTADPTGDDYLTGYVEINDPDLRNSATRTYNLDIKVGPGPFQITTRLVYGYLGDPDAVVLVQRTDSVRSGDDHFKPGIGQEIAALMIAKIRQNEAPYGAAYRARAGKAATS